MTDTKTSETDDENVKKLDLFDENSDNVSNDNTGGEDIESGIGTINEYDSVVNGGVPRTRNSDEIVETGGGFSNEMSREKSSTNRETSRRYTESDLISWPSERNARQRRHTFAGSQRENFEKNDHEAGGNLSTLSKKEKEEISVNFGPRVGQRRHTFAGSQRQNIEANDHEAGGNLSTLSEKEKEEISVNFGPHVGQRRHTFAGSQRENIEENNHKARDNLSTLSKKEKGEISVNFEPHASRRYTDGDLFNVTMKTNAGQRRHTFAGNRLDNIDDDNYLDENSTYKLSRSRSDTGIGVDLERSDALFRPQTYNISRRNTIAGNTVGKSVERERDNSLRAKRHTIAGTRVGESTVMPLDGDFPYPKPGTVDDDLISKSEDEQNLRRFHSQHGMFKRHTVGGTACEYDQNGIPSKYTFGNDDLHSRIIPVYLQRDGPMAATFRRHTIAGTGHQDMDALIEKDDLRTFQNVAKSLHGRKEDERLSKRKRSVSGPEYFHDVISDEDVRIDHQPRELSPLGRHTVAARSFIPEYQTRRRATHPGFVQDHEFTLQDDFNDEQWHSPTKSVARQSTDRILLFSREPSRAGVVYGRIDSVYEHPHEQFVDERQNFQGNAKPIGQNKDYEIRTDVCPSEDEQIPKYYVYEDRDRYSVPQTRQNNVAHVYEDEAPTVNDIIVASSIPNHGGTKIQYEEAAINQQSSDSVDSSVTPLPNNKLCEGGIQSGPYMFPAGNILLRGQDGRGNKLKFNLSVIEEESDEENYRRLATQETPADHISSEQPIHKCNYQKPATKYQEFNISKNQHRQCSCNLDKSLQYREANELSGEKCNAYRSSGNTQIIQKYGSGIKDRILDTSGKSVLERGVINEVCETSRSKKILEKEDQMKATGDTSVKKLPKSQRRKTDSRSQKTDDTVVLPFCFSHCNYQLNHPICCWHMTNSLCDECKVKQRRENVSKPQGCTIEATQSEMKSSDLSQETSRTSEGLVEKTGLDEHRKETNYNGNCEPKQIDPKCVHELYEIKKDGEGQGVCATYGGGSQIAAKDDNGNQTLETKTKNNENIQCKLQDSRPKCDTSSDRGEYKTAQETSVSEDDFSYLKLYSDDDLSSVHRKTRKKRHHRKSYKGRLMRKSSVERRMVCSVCNLFGSFPARQY